MTKKAKWITLIFGFGMLATLVAGVVAFGFTTTASAQAAVPEGAQSGTFVHPGGRGFPGRPVGGNEYLAEALGISVETLEAAHEEARQAALQMAVDQGLITQEQADAIRSGEFLPRRGFGGFKGEWFGSENGIDREVLLADALNIDVEELQVAREEARAAGLAQALEDGVITPEQLETMQAMQALKVYIDPQSLFVEALGISPEQLQAYQDEGLSRSEILDELDLTAAEVRESLQAVYQNAVQQAVDDGVITQAQADQLQNGPFGKRGGCGRGFGGRGGMAPPEGTWDGMPSAPRDNAPTNTTGISL
jgi:uncharacterized protein (DUF433 family)